MKLRRRVPAVIIAWTAVICWMIFIFSMSAQPAEESKQTSGGVAEIILRIFVTDYGELSKSEQLEMVGGLQHFVRKSAHFCGYTFMGILLSLAFSGHLKRNCTIVSVSFITGALYATSDEIHQLFVPGRSGQISDVLLDSSGVMLGILLYIAVITIVRRCRKIAE